jgi:hypothetical protein
MENQSPQVGIPSVTRPKDTRPPNARPVEWIESIRGVRFSGRRPALTPVYRHPSAAVPSWYDEAGGGPAAP